MHKLTSKILVALAALVATSLAAAQDIAWQASYSSALAEAKRTNKIVMIDFVTTWADWSKRLEAGSFTGPEVATFAKTVVPLKLNVEGNGTAQVKKFHIVNYPTILFIDKNENEVGRISGYEEGPDLVRHGKVFVEGYTNLPKFNSRYAKNKKDLEAVAGIGAIMASRMNVAQASAKLREAEAIDAKNKTGRLSDLYNALADAYQTNSDFTHAIPLFQKAADTAKETDKRAYGYLSIAACYFAMDPPNFTKAIAPLEACLKLSNLRPEDRDLARAMMDRAKQGG